MIEKICKTCKTPFKTYPSKIKLGRGKYCSHKCSAKGYLGKHFSPKTEFKKGEKNKNWNGFGKGFTPWNWNGGRISNDQGYILIHSPKHPYRDHHGYVREHRLIVEKQIGRFLHRIEVVHHINEISNDNRKENLMAFKNNVKHRRFHKGLEISPDDIIFDGSKEVMPECPQSIIK